MFDFFFIFYDENADTTVPVSVEDLGIENEQELEFIYDDKVRKVWHANEEEWYFSIVDVCQVLTDSIDATAYWRKLKQRLKDEGNETVTNCNGLKKLKLKAADGKMRKTDCANAEQLLRIIQSIPSKKSDPFKQWLVSLNKENAYQTESLFESIRHVNEFGQEFWYARELQVALEYKQWRRFENVIEKAKVACENSEFPVSEHFANVGKTSPMPNGGFKEIDDYELSRYACYLIVQNGDPRKKVIALGQSYFAVKTRQQELIENYDNLSENAKRLAIRKQVKEHNKLLVAAAKDAGVQSGLDYATFQNCGYKGLYGGPDCS